MATGFQLVFVGAVVSTVLVVIYINQSVLYSYSHSPGNWSQRKLTSFFEGSNIPRLVHYTYSNEMLPLPYHKLIEDCLKLNPDVTFIFWSDQDAYELVKKHYHDRLSLYETYIKGEREKLKKSDIIRPMILHRFGGVYMDLDTRCQKPLAPVLNKDSCIVSTDVDVKLFVMYNMDTLFMNSFMACIPRHRFFGFVIDHMTKNLHGQILHTTGPFALTKQYELYRSQMLSVPDAKKDRCYQIVAGDWRTFSPYLDKNLMKYCAGFFKAKRTPRNKQETGCLLLRNYMDHQKSDVGEGTVVHLFLNLGYSGASISKRFNIAVTFPRIVHAHTII